MGGVSYVYVDTSYLATCGCVILVVHVLTYGIKRDIRDIRTRGM